MTARLMLGDCLEQLRTLEPSSVDAIVTDPPAGISFMGKDWDTFGAKPPERSGYVAHNASTMLANGRGLTIEASQKSRRGFIEFLTVRLAECYRVARPGARMLCWALPRTSHWTGTAIEDAGWRIEDRVSHLFGTGFPKHKSKLKPACEDWWLAIKPCGHAVELNIDGCRIGTGSTAREGFAEMGFGGGNRPASYTTGCTTGRYPANVALTCCGESPCVEGCPVAELDDQAGPRKSGGSAGRRSNGVLKYRGTDLRPSHGTGTIETVAGVGISSGGASRFFYCPKASTADRGHDNTHPTVKSTALMRWLCRLITPEGGTILDPFMGSGSTGKAAALEGFGFVGIEQSPEYFAIAESRIHAAGKALAC
jgi:DNA methylase